MIVFAAIGEGNAGLTRLIIILVYLSLLLLLGFFASRLFRGTKKDYMLASSSIGPFLLLMSISLNFLLLSASRYSNAACLKFSLQIFYKFSIACTF